MHVRLLTAAYIIHKFAALGSQAFMSIWG